jgi:hypothetical protein
VVGVWDTKSSGGPLIFSDSAWGLFLTACRTGGFDPS